jgi:hypothetical protein
MVNLKVLREGRRVDLLVPNQVLYQDLRYPTTARCPELLKIAAVREADCSRTDKQIRPKPTCFMP